MTAAQVARLPLRRVRPAIVIRCAPRVPTEPMVFVLVVPPREQLRASWVLRGRP